MADARHILVSGIVQGVGFRMFTERTARSLGLSGWVRNLDDGRVEVYAEGAKEALDRLVAQCHVGPRASSVTDVSARAVDPQGALDFGTRRTAAGPDDL